MFRIVSAGPHAQRPPSVRASPPEGTEAGMTSSQDQLRGQSVPGKTHEPRRPGRPRSEQADQAILAAALDLFAQCGPDALYIEQVAARAGVGKATIYRRWPGKEDMLL